MSTFTEKLETLVKLSGKPQAQIAREAGVPPATLNNYIRKGAEPAASAAFRLAKALNVTADWMLDDTKGISSPQYRNEVSTAALASELGKRMSEHGTSMSLKIAKARKVDWIEVGQQLLQLDADDAIAPKLLEKLQLPGALNHDSSELRRFDPSFVVGQESPEILKEWAPDAEISLLDLYVWYRNLRDKPCYTEVWQTATYFVAPRHYRPPWFAEQVAEAKEKLRAAIEQAEKQPRKPIKNRFEKRSKKST